MLKYYKTYMYMNLKIDNEKFKNLEFIETKGGLILYIVSAP
jgi:hypothetical protein